MSLLYAIQASRNRLNPTAAAYINAVTAAGASVTTTQRQAINTFFKTGISEGWGASLRRFYLPIWGVAAPNAIDLIGGTSGTFAGGISHLNGYATGNGSTGYFDYGVSASSQGLSASTGLLFWLGYTGGTTGVQLGGYNGSGTGTRAVLNANASSITSEQTSLGTSAIASGLVQANIGVVLATRTSSASHKIFQRRTAFIQRGTTNTTTETSGSATVNHTAWARGQGGTRTLFSNAGLGAHGFGTGLSDSASEAFTLALKNLWETATGLTLP